MRLPGRSDHLRAMVRREPSRKVTYKVSCSNWKRTDVLQSHLSLGKEWSKYTSLNLIAKHLLWGKFTNCVYYNNSGIFTNASADLYFIECVNPKFWTKTVKCQKKQQGEHVSQVCIIPDQHIFIIQDYMYHDMK